MFSLSCWSAQIWCPLIYRQILHCFHLLTWLPVMKKWPLWGQILSASWFFGFILKSLFLPCKQIEQWSNSQQNCRSEGFCCLWALYQLRLSLTWETQWIKKHQKPSQPVAPGASTASKQSCWDCAVHGRHWWKEPRVLSGWGWVFGVPQSAIRHSIPSESSTCRKVTPQNKKNPQSFYCHVDYDTWF